MTKPSHEGNILVETGIGEFFLKHALEGDDYDDGPSLNNSS